MFCEKSELKMGVVLGKIPPFGFKHILPEFPLCALTPAGRQDQHHHLLVYTETRSCRELNLAQDD